MGLWVRGGLTQDRSGNKDLDSWFRAWDFRYIAFGGFRVGGSGSMFFSGFLAGRVDGL